MASKNEHLFLADVIIESNVQDLGADFRTKYGSGYELTDPYGDHNDPGNQGPMVSYVGNMDTGYHEYEVDYGPSYRDQTDQVDQDYGAQYKLKNSYETQIEPVKTRGRIVNFESDIGQYSFMFASLSVAKLYSL